MILLIQSFCIMHVRARIHMCVCVKMLAAKERANIEASCHPKMIGDFIDQIAITKDQNKKDMPSNINNISFKKIFQLLFYVYSNYRYPSPIETNSIIFSFISYQTNTQQLSFKLTFFFFTSKAK